MSFSVLFPYDSLIFFFFVNYPRNHIKQVIIILLQNRNQLKQCYHLQEFVQNLNVTVLRKFEIKLQKIIFTLN